MEKSPTKRMYCSASSLAVFVLRIAMGWFFLYAGIEKFLNPSWTASGFLASAKTFPAFYSWFASAANIGWVNMAVIWGEMLIGLGLIFGAFTRLASYFSILLLVLFYFPGLDFPFVKNGLIVNDQLLYILALVVLVTQRAGTVYGLDSLINKKVKNWWI